MQIRLNNISKKIKGNLILNDISFEFTSGVKYALVGNNGSGKTLLLKALSGLLIPSNGTIHFDNTQMHKDFRFYDSLGLIIETTKFYPNISGLENLKFLASLNNNISEEKIIETLIKVGLYDKMNVKVKRYSLGMIQRLAIAQAIMESPKVLLLDEPTIALDDEFRKIFFEILDEFKANNSIVIIATNEKHDIKEHYDKFIQVSNGKIVKSGDINEF